MIFYVFYCNSRQLEYKILQETISDTFTNHKINKDTINYTSIL